MQKEASIRSNFIYRSILTLSNYLMAFITFPYVSRVLGVSGVGLVNFVDNTINYFLIFASLGINVLGVREIAAVKDDKNKRSNVFSNLLGTNLFFTIVSIILYLIIISSVPRFNSNSELFYVGVSKLLFTPFIVEWFFTGIEKFKYITIRSILVKVLYVILVFTCVKSSEDYKLYFYITIATTVINALINYAYVKKYVKIDIKELLSTKYHKQNMILGLYSIMTSMYLTFNVVYLGLISDDIQVGYYTTAFKLYTVILGLFSAFTNVMLPRMSNLLYNNKLDQFYVLLNKSFTIIYTFCVPLIIISEVLAPQLIWLLSGDGFDGAIVPMRILTPAILFVGIAQILAMQILMPMKLDKVLLFVSGCGAIMSLLLNFILTKNMYAIGSSIVMLSAEIFTSCLYMVYVKQKLKVYINTKELFKNILLCIPIIVICVICLFFISNKLLCLITACSCSATIWILSIYAFDRNKCNLLLGFFNSHK